MSRTRPTSNPPLSSTPPLPPSCSSTDDLEAQPVTDHPVVVAEQNHNHNQVLVHWPLIIMEFCFTSAIEIALFEQTKSQLPLCFYLLSFPILLTFLFLFVANFIGPRFTNTVRVLEKISVLLAATVVAFSITIPLPVTFKCVTGALYALALFTVLICQR